MKLLSLPAALLLVLPAIVSAADSSEEMPTEIVVTAEDDRMTLEKLVTEAEEDVYKLFSELNDDNDFDIECRRVYRTGTLISHTQCRPHFIDELLLESGQNERLAEGGFEAGGSLFYGAESLNPAIVERYRKRLNEIMTELVMANPELARAVIRHRDLARKLKDMNGDD